MGSNMQRQAVPLINPQVPLVGTGMETIVAEDSGSAAVAPFDGKVVGVTSSYIDILRDDPDESILDMQRSNRIWLRKFDRSNQDTCINQRPTVSVGQEVKKVRYYLTDQVSAISALPWAGTWLLPSCHGMVTTTRMPLF